MTSTQPKPRRRMPASRSRAPSTPSPSPPTVQLCSIDSTSSSRCQLQRERIPERHAAGQAVATFGHFEVTGDVSAYTRAAVLQPAPGPTR